MVLHLLCTFRDRFVETGVVHNSGGLGRSSTIEGSKQERINSWWTVQQGVQAISLHLFLMLYVVHQQTRLVQTL